MQTVDNKLYISREELRTAEGAAALARLIPLANLALAISLATQSTSQQEQVDHAAKISKKLPL